MKKVLIISQNGWPPKINAQILRLTNLARHLPEYGWEPIIVARETKEYEFKDWEYAKELEAMKVYRYRGFLPWKYGVRRLLQWFFIPDVFLIDLLWNFGKIKKIIEKEDPDVIFASTPPSGLIAGYLLSKKTGKKLVVDYADPWTISGVYRPLSRFHRFVDEKIEKVILENSRVVGVSGWELKKLTRKFSIRNKPLWVPNGFDEKMFNIHIKKNKKTIFVYAGTIYREFNLSFIKIFRELYLNSNFRNKFELWFIGRIAPSRLEYIKKNGHGFTKIFGVVGNKAYFSRLLEADVLIFSRDARLDKDFMTSRLPEYIRTKKPIMLFVNKNTLIGEIVKNSGTGFIFGNGEEKRAKEFIIKAIEGKIEVKPNMDYIMQFEWSNIAKKLADALEEAAHE